MKESSEKMYCNAVLNLVWNYFRHMFNPIVHGCNKFIYLYYNIQY
jgi:hypothetical protein